MKNSITIIIFIWVTIFSCNLSAQSIIKGEIKDNLGALSFANAILLDPIDSSIIKGDITDLDGKFTFSISPNNYLLHLTMIGYKDVFQMIDIQSDTTINLSFKMEIMSTELDAVTVVGKTPLLEQKAGKLVVNIADNISGINGSMKSALKKIPGVIVTNKSVSLNGNSSVTILIDGKSTEYMDINTLLSDMSADDILKIEVSSQPDASLDASGTGGVINIILKRNVLKGTNGSIKIGAGYGEFEKYSTRISLNHRNNDLNMYGAVAYSHNSSFSAIHIQRNFKDIHFVQDAYEPSLPNTYSARLGMDYNITPKQKIGFSGKGLRNNNIRNNKNFTLIQNRNESEESSVVSDIQLNNNWNYFSTDAYYEYQIDSLGQKLNIGLNWGQFNINTDAFSEYTSTQFFPNQKSQGSTATDIKVITADYDLPISNDFSLRTGLKYSKANVDNMLNAQIEREGNFINQKELTTHYVFNESIKAAYLQGNIRKNKMDFQMGLRYEQALATGYAAIIDSTITRDITKLFPSASITVPINKKLGVVVNYSYRIQRPNYGTLNPSVYQYDPYTYRKGNQYLRPELTHSTKASLTYNAQPFFNLEYNHSNDALVLVTEQNNETGAAFATTENFDTHDQYTASLFFPLNFIKFLDGYGGVFANYHIYKSKFLGKQYDRKKPSFLAFLQATGEISKSFHVEVTGWFRGKGLEGVMEHENMYGLSFGLEKKFLDDRLIVKAGIDDVLSKFWEAKVDYARMDIQMNQKWEVRVANIEIVYKFGNRYLKKNNTKSRVNEEIERARVD